MPLNITKRHTIYKNPQYYCGPGPSVVCNDQGHLTVVFRRVRSWLSENHAGHWHPSTETCLTHSTDNGETWSPPQSFLSGYQCPDLTRLKNGTLVLSTHRLELVSKEIHEKCPTSRGVLDTPWPGIHAGTYIWRSQDNGETWSDFTNLHSVPNIEPFHPNLPIPIAVRGNVIETDDKRLLISAYTLPEPNTAQLFESTDNGQTWSYLTPIAEGFNETYLLETTNGNLLAFLRGWEKEDTYLSQSTDGGTTWSTPTQLCKGHPACAVLLPNGQIFVAYGYRFPNEYGVRAQLLSPEGTPIDKSEIIIRNDGAVSDLGYPKACLLPNGQIYLTYYINRKTDASDATAPRYIEGCILNINGGKNAHT